MSLWEDALHEECGVIGAWLEGRDAAPLAYYGLYALQHRGQESAGIAACDGERIEPRKGLGLTGDVFGPGALDDLKGPVAIG
ncbi:MAG: amidophosphoribosyltransferase, partial [Synergistaceae bacterium]|nr:amidophosphoribosyltransferase [Synergistaceae bacterium]